MRRFWSLLCAIAGLLLCLLLSPVFADAQRAVSLGVVSDLHASAPEDGESEATQEEATGGEEEAQAANAEAEDEAEAETGEEPESGTSTRHRRRAPRCVVPALQGESLSGARIALSKAHCRLGKVSEPHAHHGGLVIATQSQAAGRRLSGGTLIAVHLSAAGKTHRRR
jgi:hypothetical protein